MDVSGVLCGCRVGPGERGRRAWDLAQVDSQNAAPAGAAGLSEAPAGTEAQTGDVRGAFDSLFERGQEVTTARHTAPNYFIYHVTIHGGSLMASETRVQIACMNVNSARETAECRPPDLALSVQELPKGSESRRSNKKTGRSFSNAFVGYFNYPSCKQPHLSARKARFVRPIARGLE
jgi:hypothetical protein